MCLEQKIITFLTKFNHSISCPITLESIEYEWRQDRKVWHEKDVNDYFWILKGELLTALRKKNSDLTPILEKIVKRWGGIKRVSQETYNNYQTILRHLWTESENEFLVGQNNTKRITVDFLCPVCYSFLNVATNRCNHKPVTPLSTWTKVLAAYDPTRFWIYDARVALALRYLGYRWFIPESRSHLKIMATIINEETPNLVNEYNSYNKYLSLLLQQETQRDSAAKIIQTASHFEKRLFMLGGAIRDRYKDGDQDTKAKIIAMGCEN